MPPVVFATLGDAGIKDLRHLYRTAVCEQLPTGSPPCDELILRFPNEAAAGSLSKQTDIKDRYQIAFVPGFFSDCLNGIFYPFTDVIADLTGLGFVVHNLPTFGRASSASNAERLAKQLVELSPDPKPFIMSNVRARLEGELNAQLFLTRGLVAYVSTHPEITLGEFRGLAGVLFSQPGSSGIRSIQLAKNSVVTHIYPLKGNEAALGLRLLEHPEQKTAAKRVLDTKDTVLAGPLKLVQGGTAFVSRTPIYLTPRGGPPNSGEYWGHAGILIDEGILFSRTGILQDTDGLEYALRGRDGMGAKGEVFFGDPRVFDSTPLVLDIQIPGGSWQLAAVTLPGVLSTSSNLWLLRAGGGLLAITAAALAFFATLYNRRRSQEKLRETSRQAEEKFQALAENAQDAIVSADSLGNIIYFNKAAQRAFGYEASEVVGQPLTLLIPDRVRNQPLREVTRFIAEGEAHVVGKVIDVMGRKKSGTEFPVELSLGTWTTQEGKFVTGIFRDITERTQIAEAINEQRAFLRQVIDIDPNFIFAKDRQGRFTLVNQAVADAFGTTVQEVIGKRDTDFTADPQEVESFRSMDLEVMETLQERFIPEERITDAQGKIRWLQSVKRPIIGADGKATLVLGSSTDITHRKLVEEKLLQNQKQYAMATAAGGVSVWALDAKTGELHTDPVLPAQLGIDVAESYPRDLWTKHIHPEDLERLLENERRMLDATAPRNEEGNTLMPEIEFRGLRSDGRVIWFFGRGTVIWDKDRKPLRTIGTCRQEGRCFRHVLGRAARVSRGLQIKRIRRFGGVLGRRRRYEARGADTEAARRSH